MAGRLEKWQFAGQHLRVNAIVLGTSALQPQTSALQPLRLWFI